MHGVGARVNACACFSVGRGAAGECPHEHCWLHNASCVRGNLNDGEPAESSGDPERCIPFGVGGVGFLSCLHTQAHGGRGGGVGCLVPDMLQAQTLVLIEP